MASWFNLQLDTHAPVVTWGPPANANAGEEMTLPYALDEPSLTSAEIVLPDARVLPMTALGGVLSVVLPGDAPNGLATVRAYVEDDVGNAAVRELAVGLNGAEVTAPPAPVPGWGGRPAPKPVLVTSRTVGHGTSRDRITASSTSRSRLRARSRYTGPGQRALIGRSRATAASTARLTVATLPTQTHAVTGERATLWKRPEGPGAEDDLILLGLL